MRKILFAAAALALCLGVAACAAPQSSAQSGKAEYHKLSAQEAKARIDRGEKLIIVDVRTQEEYEEKHIQNAILIPNESIGTAKPEQLEDSDAEILVYCRSGNRSRQAAEKLVSMGYTKVYDFGGIKDWPYETVSGK